MIHETEDIRARIARFVAGDRVRVLSHHWLFKAGAESGTVERVGRTKVHVRADVNGVTYSISPFGIEES
jgi:hypothetical protein